MEHKGSHRELLERELQQKIKKKIMCHKVFVPPPTVGGKSFRATLPHKSREDGSLESSEGLSSARFNPGTRTA